MHGYQWIFVLIRQLGLARQGLNIMLVRQVRMVYQSASASPQRAASEVASRHCWKGRVQVDIPVRCTNNRKSLQTYLQILHGIPIMLQKDNCVGCCEIQPKSANMRCEQHHWYCGI